MKLILDILKIYLFIYVFEKVVKFWKGDVTGKKFHAFLEIIEQSFIQCNYNRTHSFGYGLHQTPNPLEHSVHLSMTVHFSNMK